MGVDARRGPVLAEPLVCDGRGTYTRGDGGLRDRMPPRPRALAGLAWPPFNGAFGCGGRGQHLHLGARPAGRANGGAPERMAGGGWGGGGGRVPRGGGRGRPLCWCVGGVS